MSDITDHELVANHEDTSHGFTFSEESNVHVLPQDDHPPLQQFKEMVLWQSLKFCYS